MSVALARNLKETAMNRPVTQTDKTATATSPAFDAAQVRAANSTETTFDETQLALFAEDELVSSLSNAYENRRARQVFEWEVMRRRTAEKNVRYASFA
jgi:hypothetical protein